MRRDELEHVIRAAAAITGDSGIVVIGAAALLGSVPSPPPDLMQTMEARIYPLRHPGLADVIDGAIGELSRIPRDLPLLRATESDRPRPSCRRAGRTGS